VLLESSDQGGGRTVRPVDRPRAMCRRSLFHIDQDACLAILATLALPASADGLLARCLRGNSEMLGKLSVTDPDCGHEDLLSRSPEITVRTGVEQFG
jgi:hypothetical protein